MNEVCEVKFIEEFRHLQQDTYDTAVKHGFHEREDNPLFVPTALALVASECSEALEAHRKDDLAEFPYELADIVIRVMNLAESMKIDLASAIVEKAGINKTREFKHGGKKY